MSCERGPGTADPVLHLGGFLINESDHLPQILDFSSGRVFRHASRRSSISFNMFEFWLVSIYVVSDFRALALLDFF